MQEISKPIVPSTLETLQFCYNPSILDTLRFSYNQCIIAIKNKQSASSKF